MKKIIFILMIMLCGSSLFAVSYYVGSELYVKETDTYQECSFFGTFKGLYFTKIMMIPGYDKFEVVLENINGKSLSFQAERDKYIILSGFDRDKEIPVKKRFFVLNVEPNKIVLEELEEK